MANIVSSYHRTFSIGPDKCQVMDWAVLSGSTSGTVVASMAAIRHVLMLGGQLKHSAAPTYADGTATLAFIVPAETKASVAVQGVTYTAVANLGAAGNNITVAYAAGGTAGTEVVTVTNQAISVSLQDGVSTITQVRTAVNANTFASALVVAVGTSTGAVSTAAATHLVSGVTGGAWGSCLAIGV